MNSFGLEDAQVLFDTPAGSVAPPRIEARSAIRNQFESSLTVIEVLADLLTVVLAVSGAFFVYQLLQPGSILRPPLGTIALASFAFAGLVVLLLDRDGAYLAGNSLLRIKETERSLRVSFQAFVLVLPAAFFTGHLFSRWIFFIALLSVPLLQIVEKQLLFVAVRALRARGFGVQNVLIYGAGESGRRVFSALIRSPKLGLNPVALVDDDAELEGQQVFESSYKREHSVRVIAGPISRELIERHRCELRMGHEVEVWEENNDSIVSRMDALVTGFQSVYSFEHARKMGERIRCFRPDLVHIHIFFPRLSPSIHRACLRAGVPVVQTLHNFRLLCPAATFS